MSERLTGPVFTGSVAGRALAAALCAENPGVEVEDRGAYLRILALGPCRVTRRAIEAELGGPFALERDLEPLMPAFRGRFVLSAEEARWE
jgi:hypothetical protein